MKLRQAAAPAGFLLMTGLLMAGCRQPAACPDGSCGVPQAYATPAPSYSPPSSGSGTTNQVYSQPAYTAPPTAFGTGVEPSYGGSGSR